MEPNEQANSDLAQQRENMGYQDEQPYGNGGGSGGCFPKGTKIDTPTGKLDIADLEEGDYVLSFDLKKEKSYAAKVLKKITHESNRIWRIEFDDGSHIDTTGVHSFSVQDRWEMASKVRPGDEFKSYDSSKGVVNKVVVYSGPTDDMEKVFNLVVQSKYNFAADGIIAHSFTYFRHLRIFAWNIYAYLRFSRRRSVQHPLLPRA